MRKSIISLSFYSLLSLPAFASDVVETAPTPAPESEPEVAAALPAADVSSHDGPGFYTGLRVGNYSTSVSEVSFSAPVGLVLGFGTTKAGIELEVNASDLDIEGLPMSYTTAGFYGSFRTSSKLFFKFRAGVVSQSIVTELPGSTFISLDSGSGFSASVGGGVRINKNALFDLDATVIDQDLIAVSLGLNYFF